MVCTGTVNGRQLPLLVSSCSPFLLQSCWALDAWPGWRQGITTAIYSTHGKARSALYTENLVKTDINSSWSESDLISRKKRGSALPPNSFIKAGESQEYIRVDFLVFLSEYKCDRHQDKTLDTFQVRNNNSSSVQCPRASQTFPHMTRFLRCESVLSL